MELHVQDLKICDPQFEQELAIINEDLKAQQSKQTLHKGQSASQVSLAESRGSNIIKLPDIGVKQALQIFSYSAKP